MARIIRTLPFARLTFGAVFKMLFIANLTIWAPFGVFIAVAALFGFETVRWNEAQVTGLPGLVIGLGIGAVFLLIASAVSGVLAYFGVRIWGAIRPKSGLGYFEERDL